MSGVLLLLLAAAQSAPAPACAPLEACIARIRADPEGQGWPEVEGAIAGYGDAGVVALLPLLDDRKPLVAQMAAGTLSRFKTIDPRHFPALARGFRRIEWLAGALAATGTDQALALLEQRFTTRPPGPTDDIAPAILRFGARAWPFVREQLAACRDQRTHFPCARLIYLTENLDPSPDWANAALAELAASHPARDLLWPIRSVLHRRHAPEAIPLLIDWLKEDEGRPAGSNASATPIEWLAGYGPAAAAAGPRIAAYIGRADLPEVRMQAAYAVGAIGYEPAAAALLAIPYGDLEQDWRLAYNTAESLGRLGVAEARPLLERLTAVYWDAPVRNNARRALNLLAGGAFAIPGIDGDAAPYDPGRGRPRGLDNPLRYAGDMQGSRWTTRADPKQAVPLSQSPPGEIAVPASGSVYVAPLKVSAEAEALVRRKRSEAFADGGTLVLTMPYRNGWILGFDGGEWGGGLAYFGSAHVVPLGGGDDVQAAFRWGGRFYLITNMWHMDAGPGTLWEIDLENLRTVRRIRLPFNVSRIAVSSRGALILETGGGAIAMRLDGSLADPALFSEQ